MTARQCAFCGATEGLTNEHIFPHCLYERSGPGQIVSIAHTPAGDKPISSELQIGDVCGTCNNGSLSALDKYVCNLHDKYFKTVVHAGDRVRFKFDYDLLLRWLLKVGYNVARARGWIISSQIPLPGYILGPSPRPRGFRLFLQLVIPTPTGSREWEVKPNADEIPPVTCSIGLFDVRLLRGFSMAFKISLNSYWFYVFQENPGVPKRVRDLVLKEFIKQIPGAYEISGKAHATVYASSIDFMSAVDKDRVFQQHLRMAKQHNDRLKESAASRQKKRIR